MTKAASVSPPEVDSLRNSREFRRVLDNGERRRNGGIVTVTAPGSPGTSRVGIVVSKSSGNAVVRNRIKRRLRPLISEMSLKPGVDYVIIANSSVAEVEHARLRRWLEMSMGEKR